jgi:hypothetical protein
VLICSVLVVVPWYEIDRLGWSEMLLLGRPAFSGQLNWC